MWPSVLGAPKGGSPSVVAAAAYSWQFITDASMPPAPGHPSWTSSTKFNDVGVNDHTTYEEVIANAVNPSNRFLVLHDAGSAVSAVSSTVSVYITGDLTVLGWDWNGSSWVSTGIGISLPGVVFWSDLSPSRNGGSFRYRVIDIDVEVGSPGFYRIGDWRINT